MRNHKQLRLIIALLLLMGVPILYSSYGKNTAHASIVHSIGQFKMAWSNADSRTLASLFTDDGDLMIPEGLMMTGRPAIASFYGQVFANGYKGSRAGSEIKQIRTVGNNLAIVDGEWSISGARDSMGHDRQTENGVFCAVFIRRCATWFIRSLREQTSAKHIQLVH